jgi:hypothetical protein
MYDTTPNNKIQDTLEHLTKAELSKLKRMVLGYGNFTKTAERAELPKPTLRDVILRGYGMSETIRKVRAVLYQNQRQAA